MGTEFFELRPDKLLIDQEFEKYQLSLDKIAKKSENLKTNAKLLSLPDRQSYERFLLHYHHNYLFLDNWTGKSYWINEDNEVESKDGIHFKIPFSKKHDYVMCPNLLFPCPSAAILSDGFGNVYILSTSHKNNNDKWKMLMSHKTFIHKENYISEKHIIKKHEGEYQPSIVIDSLYKAASEDNSEQCGEFQILSLGIEERINLSHVGGNIHKRQFSEIDDILHGKDAIKFVKTTTLSTLDKQTHIKDTEIQESSLQDEINTTQEHLKQHLRGQGDGIHFVIILEWVTFKMGSNSLPDSSGGQLTRKRILETPSHMNFACIERSDVLQTSALHILSDMPFKFVYDSVLPDKLIVLKKPQQHSKIPQKLNKQNPIYYWSQEENDLIVKILVPEGIEKSDVKVHFKTNHLKFELSSKDNSEAAETLLEGTFAQNRKIKPEGSTWNIVSNKSENDEIYGNYIEIMLASHPENQGHWPNPPFKNSPFFGQMDPDYCKRLLNDIDTAVSNGETADEYRNLLKNQPSEDPKADSENNVPLTQPYNLQELEECDSYPEDTSLVARYDGNTHNITHQSSLSNNQFLFSCQPPKPGDCPIFVVRHDVHATFWQPITPTPPKDIKICPWKNILSFEALGYVIASKENRKILSACLSPSQTPYAVVGDNSNHLFVYFKQIANPAIPLNDNNGVEEEKSNDIKHEGNILKNRKTGRTFSDNPGDHRIGLQKLITLETSDELHDLSQAIIGLNCLNDKINVLSVDRLTTIHI